jgi:hypothetical protein
MPRRRLCALLSTSPQDVKYVAVVYLQSANRVNPFQCRGWLSAIGVVVPGLASDPLTDRFLLLYTVCSLKTVVRALNES